MPCLATWNSVSRALSSQAARPISGLCLRDLPPSRDNLRAGASLDLEKREAVAAHFGRVRSITAQANISIHSRGLFSPAIRPAEDKAGSQVQSLMTLTSRERSLSFRTFRFKLAPLDSRKFTLSQAEAVLGLPSGAYACSRYFIKSLRELCGGLCRKCGT